MTRKYVYEDGEPGRPRTRIDPKPPPDFDFLDTLSSGLDADGWYRELSTRRRRAFIKERYDEDGDAG